MISASTLHLINFQSIFFFIFLQKKLEELSGVFLLTLGASLVNDDSSNCKKTISSLIKTMLGRLDKAHRDQLFDVLLVWFKGKKVGKAAIIKMLLNVEFKIKFFVFTCS